MLTGFTDFAGLTTFDLLLSLAGVFFGPLFVVTLSGIVTSTSSLQNVFLITLAVLATELVSSFSNKFLTSFSLLLAIIGCQNCSEKDVILKTQRCEYICIL